MSTLALTLPLLLASLAPSYVSAATRAELQVVSFTGQIQVTENGKVTVIDAGKGETARAIRSGAEIAVLSGEAVIQIGDTAVSASKGDGFSFTSRPNGRVSVTGTSGAPVMMAGENTAVIAPGSIVAVRVSKDSAVEMSVVSGDVKVTKKGKAHTPDEDKADKTPTAPSDLRDAPISPKPGRGGANNSSDNEGGSNSRFGRGDQRVGPNPNQEQHAKLSRSHP